uniref:Ig-like domain-containing protein n=1 Tax=Terrapene triunguis TaxID=2587831 RepID=A0A674IEA8_9SAUR
MRPLTGLGGCLCLALTSSLLCADPSLPKPSISLSPTWVTPLGADVTIRCQGQRRDVRFFLHKAGDLNPQQHVDPAGDGAEFRITTVSRQHGGNYSCSYRPQSEPFISSQPSDTIELVVGSYPKPSISVSPGGVIPVGGNITIRCQYQLLGMTFLLYKAGDVEYLNYTDPAGSEAEFPITSARREHGGNYTCHQGVGSSCSGVWSLTSRLLSRLLAGRENPKPTISVSPSRVMALGENITIRCEGLYSGTEFFLRKAGHPNLQVRTVPDGTVAEFPITSVGRKDGGNYTCDYHSIMDQNRSSYPSDPVRIIVGGEGGARLRGVSLGGAVSIWCRGQRLGVRFVLNKERRHFPPVDSDGFGVVFPINNVRREQGGSYSCSYHSRSEPFAVSYPSDPVELVVRGEGPGSASPFPAPPPARPSRGLGANGMLRARHPQLVETSANAGLNSAGSFVLWEDVGPPP